jgi:hypothetical protein
VLTSLRESDIDNGDTRGAPLPSKRLDVLFLIRYR